MLNKCRKCKNRATVYHRLPISLYEVKCDVCDNSVHRVTSVDAIEAWNAQNPEELKDPCVDCAKCHSDCTTPNLCQAKKEYEAQMFALSKRREQDEQKGLYNVILNQRRQLRILHEQMAKMKQNKIDDIAGAVQAIKDETQVLTHPESAAWFSNTDSVQNPSHYTWLPGVECKDVIMHFSCFAGNAIKYIWRAGRKSPDAVEDLRKAQECIKIEIERLESEAKND